MSVSRSTTGPDPGDDAGVAVSVVVPVHDAMPYLVGLLRSLAEQDLDADAYEVILVDDGSTDEGPRVLDAWAADRPQARVVHQENSGWPGAPRNRGLELARGRYVFFADADDELGPEALRRMVEFADEQGSDVLVPRSVGVGRFVPYLFRVTRVDADLERVFHTLTPQKLFRRSLLEREQIRFPEEKVRLEDGMMLARAYLLADRVSFLGGEVVYHLISRDDGQNISVQDFDPDGYTWSIGEVARLIRENDPDPGRADRVVLDLYRRTCLKFYQPARWSTMPRARREKFLAAHRRFMDVHIPPALEDQLAEPFRTRSRLVRAGDAAGLDLEARESRDRALVAALVASATWRRLGGLRLSVEVHGARAGDEHRPLHLVLRRRGGDVVETLDLGSPGRVERPEGRPCVSVFDVSVPTAALSAGAGTTLDLYIQVEGEKDRTRLAAPLVSVLPPARSGNRVYSTVQNNLSIECGAG
ncbi:glycosyltransferase family 2 protein [Serinicoccus marinus]|uniref:glycosyltransferase family 2 protein n=1 Tax=Serinicoccus marinus TaxID=247333 RepID=UPI0003B720FA|nr:glycosyltransferase family 2 protein [Serinicoccus marinus]